MTNRLFQWSLAAFLTLLAPAAFPASRDAATTATATATVTQPARDPRWAAPMNRPGLPNLHKINGHLYRGAQPEDEGYATLKKMGIKTVINLREHHDDRKLCAANGLKNITIPLKTWDVEPEEIHRFLQAIHEKGDWPVFVHCQHGADRTGLMCAYQRIVDDGWTKDEAIREMTQGGYGYHEIWKNLIEVIREMDVEKIKRLPDAGPD